jgi:uncharacterized protein with PQ loop repeat
MAIGYHHWTARKKSAKLSSLHSAKTKKILDGFIYAASFLSVGANLPQLLKIWTEHNATGVSLFSWIAFFLSSLFWMFYGFVYKKNSIILLNISLAVVQFLIVLGILVNR